LLLLRAKGHFAFGLSAKNETDIQRFTDRVQMERKNAHIPMVGGRRSEDVGVLFLDRDVLGPKDRSSEAVPDWLCGTTDVWRIY
jgi:hypothetical protein